MVRAVQAVSTAAVSCRWVPPRLTEGSTFPLQLEKRAEAAGWSFANRTGTGTSSLDKELIMFFRYLVGTFLKCHVLSSESWLCGALCRVISDQRLSPAPEASGCTGPPGKTCQTQSVCCLFTSLQLMYCCLYLLPFIAPSCSRLQGTLRHCAPSWWEKGLRTLWHQKTWTPCPLGPISSFDTLTLSGTGEERYQIILLLKILDGKFFIV